MPCHMSVCRSPLLVFFSSVLLTARPFANFDVVDLAGGANPSDMHMHSMF